MLNENAGVFHYSETGRTCPFSCGGVRDVLLKPENLCPDDNRRVSDGKNLFGPPKNVHKVNGFRNVFEASESPDAENFRLVRIDRDDAVADGLQVGGDSMRRTKGIGGKTDDSDGLRGTENLADRVRRWSDRVGAVEVHLGVG